MNPEKVPENIGQDEELGRSVFSRRRARRARRSRVPADVFLEKEGEPKISVDRLSIASPDEATEIAEAVAAKRNANATFYGWAFLTASRTRENGREALASPLESNPYHADIVLPEAAVEDREEQQRHALELADASDWRESPNSSQGST